MQRHVIHTAQQLSPILRGLRIAAGLSQAELAVRMGISRQAMSALERHPEKATFERLMKLWALLELEVSLASAPAPRDNPADW